MEKAFWNSIEMEYIDWIFFIWKCMLECGGKWDVEIDFFFFIMEMGVGNLIENEISWVIFLCMLIVIQ